MVAFYIFILIIFRKHFIIDHLRAKIYVNIKELKVDRVKVGKKNSNKNDFIC